MSPRVSEKSLRHDVTAQTLKIFGRHTLAYWPMLLLCASSVLILIGCDIVSPLIYKRFFDQLAVDPLHPAARAGLAQIYHTILLIAIMSAISWIAYRACHFAVIQFESRTMKDLTDHCFAYLQNHSHRFFTDNFAGALVKRVNRFAASFEITADQITLDIGQTLLRIIFVVGVLFWRNVTLGCVFLAWTIAFMSFNFFFARWKLKFDLARAELDTKVTARLADTIANAVNLKLFAAIDREVGLFKNLTGKHQRARSKAWMLGWNSEGLQGFSIRALEIVVLVIAVRYWFIGLLTLGDFVLLRSYLYQLTDNVRQMGQDIRRIYEAMADANEMTEILLAPHEIVDAEPAAILAVAKGAVEFRNVQFSYTAGSNLVLRDFSLKIRAGERVGIVGPSGGGKSTVLKLLVRLHDVNGGHILIDNQDCALVSQSSLHQNIAYVPQDPILFHRSLMENIRYSKPTASGEDVIRAAKLAHCHEFISSFPDGYETLVGERGVKLSGGERQRVAIARAILMDAPIFILDEATSSLDSESEMYIQDSLANLFMGRTVIAVAHRLSTIRKMDRIVVVKDGHIIEEGSHDLLVKMENGLYQKLWNLQSTDAPPMAQTAGYLQ
ncbi:MAG: ABC transporter ATP-binding protein [Bryobacterales bacterium]|nr:ABC transporter ATP-binding protein [Bryobacterales bacterium]MBV9401021.1 ABC transporter ATP-binding protein [Bryobacterales bacterium]